MENLNITSLEPLTQEELNNINGGRGWAYDVGFAIRSLYVYMANGGNPVGGTAGVALDVALNYRPA